MTVDLAVVIVAFDAARDLPRCLSSLNAHAGEVSVQVVVVDNGSRDDSAAVAEAAGATVVRSQNHGFAHGCNLGVAHADARHVLFLNPDVEIVDGRLDRLLALLDRRPRVGAIGVRQVGPDGTLDRTIRRFPSPLRMLGEAVGPGRLPVHASWLGERELRDAPYQQEVLCDWTPGSFLLVRGRAYRQVGGFDERFFLYSEETDLCRRLHGAGWQLVHTPAVTVVHHENPGRASAELVAQDAWSRRLYAEKHLTPPRRLAFLAALWLRHVLRAVGCASPRRSAAREALRVLSGRRPPPLRR